MFPKMEPNLRHYSEAQRTKKQTAKNRCETETRILVEHTRKTGASESLDATSSKVLSNCFFLGNAVILSVGARLLWIVAAYARCRVFMCYKVTEVRLKRDTEATAICDALFWIFE